MKGTSGHILSAVSSQRVQNARPGTSSIQHGVMIPNTYTPQGDGTTTDMTATSMAWIGITGAYFDAQIENGVPSEYDQGVPVYGTLATTAIGDLYAPRGDERVLLLSTGRGYSMLYEHGHDDTPATPVAGERYMLHRSNQGSYDAGIRFLNDGPTSNDNLGTTEIGYRGAQTSIVTKGGWQIVEDDTHNTLTIKGVHGSEIIITDVGGSGSTILLQTPGGTKITINDTGSIGLGSPGGLGGIVRLSDFNSVLNTLATNLQAWGRANFQGGSNITAVAPTMPSPTASSVAYAG